MIELARSIEAFSLFAGPIDAVNFTLLRSIVPVLSPWHLRKTLVAFNNSGDANGAIGAGSAIAGPVTVPEDGVYMWSGNVLANFGVARPQAYEFGIYAEGGVGNVLYVEQRGDSGTKVAAFWADRILWLSAKWALALKNVTAHLAADTLHWQMALLRLF